ncbi:uncharacterized protein [Heptranchias perlo]|uniref:uncharacterized protein n=1 Tax=Heptranchias perlo TaxID=212740 RepID=UPI003559F026
MNWDPFPHSGAPAAAGSCSDGGPREDQFRPAFYQSPWMRLLSVFYRPSMVLFHRSPPGEVGETQDPSPLGPVLDKMRAGSMEAKGGFGLKSEAEDANLFGGLLTTISHWVGAVDSQAPGPEPFGCSVSQEDPPRPLRDCGFQSAEASSRSHRAASAPGFQGLLGKVWGKAYPGPLEAYSWQGVAHKAACLSQSLNRLQLNLDQWTCDYPASSTQQVVASEKSGFSIQANTKLPGLPLSAIVLPTELSHCSGEMGVITPDQDYGYSSLEEEHTCSKQQPCVYSGNGVSPELVPNKENCSEGNDLKDNKDNSVEHEDAVLLHRCVDSPMTKLDHLVVEDRIISLGDDEWDSEESSSDESEGDTEEEENCPPLPRPQCSNKTIAFILGSNPSSDDDDDSEDEESDWDDDGFDSEGSSELSDSDETGKLWNSLAGSSDPYNLLNFQACIKTEQKLDTSIAFKSSCPQQPELCSSVLEEDEDRLDSGFSDSVQGELQKTFAHLASERKRSKKVAFDEHVTEYYVSSEEIRKGPWEEYARDRCRFQKRIRETEEYIGYCFTLEHRRTVLERMRPGQLVISQSGQLLESRKYPLLLITDSLVAH